ncbi:MAG: hypothetical protein AAGI63_06035 [Planctomycetota bacterium]
MTEYPIGSAEQIATQLQANEHHLRELIRTGSTPRAIQRLRRFVSEPACTIVLESARLQSKAIKKLGFAESERTGSESTEPGVWWVNDRSLQQATPWQVAQHKSRWVKNNSIVDLCCGVGGDAMQFPASVSITAIDRDPLIAAMAKVNLRRRDHPERVEVRCQEVESFLPMGFSGLQDSQLHIDPDRRVSDRRHTAVDGYEPEWQWVKETADRFPTMVKLAPAARLSDEMLPSLQHRCWISLQRSVREQTLLCGELVDRNALPASGRSAVMIAADATARLFAPPAEAVDLWKSPGNSVTQPKAKLVDPDPAIRAGELTVAFAETFGLSMIGGPTGFLTTDQDDWPEGEAMAIASTVIWHGRCDLKIIRKELRDRNAYAETLKVRGTDHDPSKILKSLRKTGDQPLTLWIGRNTERVYAALTV